MLKTHHQDVRLPSLTHDPVLRQCDISQDAESALCLSVLMTTLINLLRQS